MDIFDSRCVAVSPIAELFGKFNIHFVSHPLLALEWKSMCSNAMLLFTINPDTYLNFQVNITDIVVFLCLIAGESTYKIDIPFIDHRVLYCLPW